LGYEIEAKINTIDFDTHQDLVPVGVSPLAPIVQDVRDVIRQEYVDYGLAVPLRSKLVDPPEPNYNTGNYSIIYDDKLESINTQLVEAFNLLLRNDVQVTPVGITELPPNTIVVSAGPAIKVVGRLWSTVPEGDDVLDANSYTILAGQNGVAETVVNNQVGDNTYTIPVSSAYRNPQRNKHPNVDGSPTSYHVQGRAIDYVPPTNIPGLNDTAELYCMMDQAGESFAARSLTEHRETGENIACDDTNVDHLHVRN
ncbi:MAG: hypothetical protein GY820_22595, partial [Gammaproteobacteria bacterium]|nr:hypothetical protein [Gammaproteobacteria bacterium]